MNSSGEHGCDPSSYVMSHPHPLVERVKTAVVHETAKPVWNHEVKTKVPKEMLDFHVRCFSFFDFCTFQLNLRTLHYLILVNLFTGKWTATSSLATQ